MKIIITETQHRLIRRVYGSIQEYLNKLHEDADDICTYWTRAEGSSYVANAMADLIIMIQEQYWGLSHNEIYGLLEDFGVLSDIKDFFYNTFDECEK
jgi:hypothetical protein